ncbi:Ca(2+)-binding ATP:ADP antiporter [Pichia kluyveri]|uniref:Ca(2+)-binding ATP:ADP antiporter n=1 Tax=Pichia kluyveri TaxID=36015 RepID=A0AAV5RA15_PICKL|nr:Ca(2+)-binding ATP:ADP antiporter [Pichia kluyveri]
MFPNESPDDKRKRHQQIFESIDKKHTGYVTFKEFQDAMKESNHPLKDSPFAMEEIYRSFSNNSKKGPFWNRHRRIDFDKFNKYLMTAESQIEKGFHNVDKDNDGKITPDDVSNYLSNIGCKPAPEEMKNFFQNLDVEKKGYITYSTFRDSLLFMPRLDGSRIRTAYKFFNDDLDNLSSEGDVTVGDDILNSVGYFLAGGLSGVVSRTCTAPLDRIKVFLIARTDLSSTLLKNKNNLIHQIEEIRHKKIEPQKIESPLVRSIKTIYKQGGIKAFYVGNGLNVIKVFPESAMKFGSFEATKKIMCQLEGVDDEKKLSKFSTYLSGGIGGVLAQTTVYPIDTLKYRLQCASLDSKIKGTKLLFRTASDLYKEGGIRVFYRGLIVGLSGMFPYAALDLGTFTTVKKWYIKTQAAQLNCSVDDVQLPNYIVLSIGASSGTFGATMVYPINLLRTRLQAQGTYAHPYTYTGFTDVFKQTVQREGIQGLFKGLVPNLAKVIPAVSISYLMYENLKKLFKLDEKR